MAITQDEMNSIVSAVLSAIRTNSRTIDQLTPVTSLSDNDSFEINGGKRVTYKVLSTLIASLSSSELDTIKNLIDKFKRESDLKLNDIKSDLQTQSEWKDSHEMQFQTLLSGHGQHAQRLGALEVLTEETVGRVDDVEAGVERNRTDIGSLSKALDTLTQTKGTAGIIDTFRDVEDFLAGFSDSESESLKKILDSKADGAAVSENIRRLSETSESLARYCDNLAQALDEYQHRDYRSVVQLDKVSLDPDEMVSVKYVEEPVTLGGVIEYYEPGYFVLLATDGERYDKWSQRWRIYDDAGKVRTDVLFLLGDELWHWTGKTMEPVVAELTDAEIDAAIESLDIDSALPMVMKKYVESDNTENDGTVFEL